MIRSSRLIAGVLALSVLAPVRATSVDLAVVRDNTIYSESGSVSNGGGERIFAGRTNMGRIRRGLLAFDVAGGIPSGAVVSSVTLTLYCSKAGPGSPAQSIALHRVLADWGQADSDGGFEEGQGAAAQAGDATWTERFFGQGIAWSSNGGDFVAQASATSPVGGPGAFYSWSSAGMVADVQAWVDDPSSNHGWLLMGNEVTDRTARRFDSSSIEFAPFRPVLTVELEEADDSVGSIPDGASIPGTPLLVARAPGDEIDLTWSASCKAADTDYAVYEGEIGSFGDRSWVTCSTGGALTHRLDPSFSAAYYLVVPVRGSFEGSYGRSSEGAERVAGAPSCDDQSLSDPVCP